MKKKKDCYGGGYHAREKYGSWFEVSKKCGSIFSSFFLIIFLLNIKTITFKNAYNIIHIGVLGKNILIIPLFSAFVSGCSFYYGSGSGNQVRILWLGQDYLFRWDIFSLELLLSKVIFPYYFILEIFGEYWII